MPEGSPPEEQLNLLAAQVRVARGHVEAGTVLPPGTRFGRLKGLALRALQLITREQVAYNQAVLEALDTAARFAAAAEASLERAKADEAMRSIAEAHLDAQAMTAAPAASPPAPSDQGGRSRGARPATRPRAVMLSTFRVGRRFNGGELRSYHLARAMAARFEVEIVSLGGRGEPASRTEIAPGVLETVIPRSLAQHAVELSYQRDLGLEVPVGDTLMPELLRFTPDYLEHASTVVRGAAVVQLEHPFMFPAVEHLEGRPPLVYNAHNAEFQMKRDMLPATAVGDSLLERVSDVEGAVVAAAAVIATCSREDADNLRAAFGGGSARWVDVPNGVSLEAVPFTGAADRHALGADWLRRLQVGGGRITGVRRAAVFIANGQPSSWEAAEAIIAAAPGMPTTCFLLVGTHAVRFRARVLPPNVVALGPVADYARRLLLAGADAGLNPMTSGSGSNLKVPEYLAAGLPVVATPYGVRGFDVEDAVHVRLTPVEDLAVALDAVYDDEAGTEAIALRGRALVEERYRWEDIGARLTSVLGEVAGC